MNDLTPHQLSIFKAMLLGLRLQTHLEGHHIVDCTHVEALALLPYHSEAIRIAPGQESKTVRLYGFCRLNDDDDENIIIVTDDKSEEDDSFMEFSKINGCIVGGKIGETK